MSKFGAVVWPKLLLFGDSITEVSFQPNGWGADIANKLARKCDVINRGLSGYNSRWARILLPRLLGVPGSTESHFAAVTVFFGANDAALKDEKPQQHVPLQEYAENLKELTKILASSGVSADKVIFITPPPIHEQTWEKECIIKGCALNRVNAVTGQYAQACVEAAAQSGVDVLDLWTLMQKDGQDYSEYLCDGLHLSQKGNQFVSEQLWMLLQRRVEHLPLILPYWADVDVASPETSLLCD
ncbi:isoamyl acetate-hydrolyzing esterase 1 homolog [Eucyclogobius newberryi]|uniref:isoamyl acetate-hydrolyzing esterase 1 homolog n=1 Tax=Eucyclogobius newberryi TaxID=166745 RepID=UPI003B5A1AD7